ncbi:hypothetical protein PMAYCL1PPCAC_32473 [Pristionchus mayeri]|uniref:Amidase domain-containing protein n=1 Tax=Pristionchus mayeri TaxID=1317129 RepID=A0AAN5IDH2_9BILA|nr:hypothetical protein PMAYCL1PPCAC_32473 [Pristionchus mayeri]
MIVLYLLLGALWLCLIFIIFSKWFAFWEYVFRLINWILPRKAVPPATDPLLLLSAKQAARAIRERKVTSEALVRAYISRIGEVNQIINAMVEHKFEAALKQARSVDKEIESATQSQIEEIARSRPFLGVPLTVKECIEVAGYGCTIGIVARKGRVSAKTAIVVQRLQKAGCIVLCKTNVPEMCLSFITTNHVYGRTSNPYDNRRTSGGSSGGEGALIAAGGSVIGMGSDIGGSIRFPAHFNGVFGLKTSCGLVDISGHLPELAGFRLKMLTIGPICRYAEDLEGMTRVMAGEMVRKVKLGVPIEKGSIRLFYMPKLATRFMGPCCPDTRDALARTVSALEKRYEVTAERLYHESTGNATGMFISSLQSNDQPSAKQLLTDGNKDFDPALEIVKIFLGKKEFTLSAVFVSLLEEWKVLSDEKMEKFRLERDQLAKEFRELLGENGVIICPTYPTAAPFHNQGLYTAFNFSWGSLFNVLSLPAVQCPVGFNKDGMPIGVQIVGPEYSDGMLIKLAEEMEHIFGGWKGT